MRYIVDRTSAQCMNDPDRQPCPESWYGPCVFTDLYTFASFEEHDAKTWNASQPFQSIGRNHRTTTCGKDRKPAIARDRDSSAWFVELPDLAALTAFIERHGECVVFPPGGNYADWQIEIYDDHRE